MPAALSWDEFLDVIREAGLVNEQDLGPFLEQWQKTTPQSKDTVRLAEGMLKAGLLTTFQKENLLQGKRRGYVIADKYILLNHLGAGGMGSVWLCQHKVMRRRVAIKVLPSNFAKDPEYLERFHREARAAAALDHPNIVRAFDVDQDDKLHFLVMEYVEGCSLHDKVDEGLLPAQQAADYISQAAAGLQHAHESGMVHRDIKPGNLLVDRKGTVKILDMGLALLFQEKGKSLTQQYDANAVLGTAEFLAPEQVLDSHNVDIRADIYSLGLTFFYLLAGKSPYGDEGTVAQKLIWHQVKPPKSIREFRPDVPEGLAAVIDKMLAKNAADRYQTPDEVVKALVPWVRGDGHVPTGDGVSEATGENRASPGTMISRRGPETIRASDADTAVKVDEEETGRAGKKSKSDLHDKRKSAKSDKNLEDSDTRRSKGKAVSGKHKRSKTAAGFWTPQNIALVGAGSLVGVTGLVILLVVLLKKPAPLPAPVDPNSIAQIKKDESHPDEKKDQQKPPEAKDGLPKKVDPPQKDNVEPKKDNVEPKKDNAPKKDTPTKDTPAKDAPAKDTPAKDSTVKKDKTDTTKKPTKKPPVKEALADYFPKPGSTLFYDVADYKTKAVTRQKWDYTDKGVINVSLVQVGVIEKDTLLKNGQVKWLKPFQGKDQVFYRTEKTHIELGQTNPQTKAVVWEPILPLTASLKDTWKVQLANGDFKDYSVLKFDKYKSKKSVIIQDSFPAPGGGHVVTQRTYAQGIGEVTRTQSLESPSAPQLLSEAKLVDQ